MEKYEEKHRNERSKPFCVALHKTCDRLFIQITVGPEMERFH